MTDASEAGLARLRRALASIKATDNDVAHALRVPVRTISRLRSGDARPTAAMIGSMIKTLRKCGYIQGEV